MHAYRRGIVAAVPAVKVSTVVFFLTGGLVGVMAYTGSVAPLVWVLAVLLGVWGHGRLPRSAARWRGVVAGVSLVVAGGILGTIAYYGTFDVASVFAGACLVALAVAPEASV
jgi:hypothetical protein